jgi:hypothetical protein
MLMVGTDAPRVEQDLVAGELRCPACAGELRPWGHASRRTLRDGSRDVAVVPRRSRCQACRLTHVLLPLLALLRRRDLAEVIAQALLRRAAGAGHRSIARALGAPAETVRGWLGRFGDRADLLRRHFTRLLVLLDPSTRPIAPAPSPFGDVVAAILAAWAAACRRFAPSPLGAFVAGATGGRLINTSSGLPVVG